MPHYSPFLAILLGLLVGSFLNVVICRLPLGQSIVVPRSHCPQCGRFIPWYDNIPLISFLLLVGSCRFCQKKISWQYPLVELVTGLLSFLTFLKFGSLTASLLYFLLLVCPLIAITFIDFHHKIIPDVISLSGIPVGLIVSLLVFGISWKTLNYSLLGILTGGGALFLVSWIYEKTRKREGLGMGDVKLTAMLGAFFGWKGVFFVLLMSSMIGSIVGLVLILIYRKGLQYAIPFGPFLAAAALLYLYFGPELITFYLSLTQRA